MVARLIGAPFPASRTYPEIVALPDFNVLVLYPISYNLFSAALNPFLDFFVATIVDGLLVFNSYSVVSIVSLKKLSGKDVNIICWLINTRFCWSIA
ncbi:hypothetical protein D3C80_1850480 [compost metagenome]